MTFNADDYGNFLLRIATKVLTEHEAKQKDQVGSDRAPGDAVEESKEPKENSVKRD